MSAVQNQKTTTLNGMKARVETGNANVDFFFKAGAMRGHDIRSVLIAAMAENSDHALRILQWLRDIREGAGERELFRNALRLMESMYSNHLEKLLSKIPEIGRFDDLLVFNTEKFKLKAFEIIKNALYAGNQLCFKWMPREKSSKRTIANELREYLGLSPKQYRKFLANGTKVVESQMCQNDWDNINFSHVPSKAASLYKRAFMRHTDNYEKYVDALVKGDPSVKVNAGAIFPHDVIHDLRISNTITSVEINFIEQQWNALPNFIGEANILPMVDVSGSMHCSIGNYKSKAYCVDVAIGLGLYCADKNQGKFKDTFLTFSESPELLHLEGNIVEKFYQMSQSRWGMNTNLEAAFDIVLKTAIDGKVPQSEMPSIVLILSDMQFDSATNEDETAIKMIKGKFKDAGYEIPKIVFWNLNSYDNVPVKFDKNNTALVSGFSPSILTAILKNDMEKFTPYNIMLETIMSPRYDII